MDDSHYDEFGNYIGPALSDSDVVSRRDAAGLLALAMQHAGQAAGCFPTYSTTLVPDKCPSIWDQRQHLWFVWPSIWRLHQAPHSQQGLPSVLAWKVLVFYSALYHQSTSTSYMLLFGSCCSSCALLLQQQRQQH
jgi:hypothetical protein